MSQALSNPKYRSLLALSALVALAACGGSDDVPGDEAASDAGRSTALAKPRVPPPPPAPPPPAAPSPLGPPSPPVDSTVVGALALASSTAAGQSASGFAPCGISANGNLVTFRSESNTLVANDSNGVGDVFLKNLSSGAVQRISTSSSGAQLAQAAACRQMTPDGRFVLMQVNSAVLVKDVQTGVLTQVSPAADSIPNNTGFSAASISDDGNVVTLVTIPTQTYVGAYQWVNTVPARIMVRNLATGTLTTLNTDNGRAAEGEVVLGHLNARLSPDGRRVAFVSTSSTLVGGDSNGQADVFVRDLASGITTLASSSSSGVPATLTFCCHQSYYHVEWANNAVLQFSIGQAHSLGPVGEYLKNVDTGALQLLLASSDGASPVVSADLRKMVFGRLYGSGFDYRIFSRHLATGAEQVVSSSSSGTPGNGNANVGLISRDGARVVFNSNATNLFSPTPPAGTFQVYVKTIDTP